MGSEMVGRAKTKGCYGGGVLGGMVGRARTSQREHSLMLYIHPYILLTDYCP